MAAKAAELRDMGVDVPDVVAVERTAVAANWQAGGGWTDGQHRLGTSPEKDVGFPYRSSLVPRRNAELDERMMRHSWQSYLVATGSVRRVDRPRPAGADPSPVEPVPALGRRQRRDECGRRRGHRHHRDADAGAAALGAADRTRRTVQADALMITGPGQAERSILPGNPRVLSIAQFWHRAAAHELIAAERVAVIGGGETAATMLNELFRHRVSTITVISPQVTLFTRGEGFFENMLYSDPTHWAGLTLGGAARRDGAHRPRGVLGAGAGGAARR